MNLDLIHIAIQATGNITTGTISGVAQCPDGYITIDGGQTIMDGAWVISENLLLPVNTVRPTSW